MSILDKIINTKPRAPRITLYGKGGIGKSTLAAQFPEPLFLLTEETGLSGIDALPVAVTFKEIWDSVNGLLKEPDLQYKTIVVDSISKLDALIIKHILDEEPINKSGKPATLNSACGGYGAGVLRAQSMHSAFKAQMDKFQDRGVCVIYVSHVAIVKIKSPDAEDYDIFSIVMNSDKSRESYINDVDCVAFCCLKSYTTQNDSGRSLVVSGGERVLRLGMDASNISKNRFNMPNELPLSFDSFKNWIPFYESLRE